jgi:hypothetical protein
MYLVYYGSSQMPSFQLLNLDLAGEEIAQLAAPALVCRTELSAGIVRCIMAQTDWRRFDDRV